MHISFCSCVVRVWREHRYQQQAGPPRHRHLPCCQPPEPLLQPQHQCVLHRHCRLHPGSTAHPKRTRDCALLWWASLPFHGPALPHLKRIGAQEWAGPGPVPPLTYVLFWARAPAQLLLPSHDIPAFCWIGFDSLDVSGNCGGSLSRAAWESHGCCWEAVEAEFAVLLWL